MAKQKKVKINQWLRLLWHVNRSPLKLLVKQVLLLRYRAAVRERKALVAQLPTNSGLDALASNLVRDGYVIMNDVIDPQTLAALSAAGETKLARADEAAGHQVSEHKDFWVRLLDEDMQDGMLPVESPFVRFALQPAVVGVLGRVLGELPQLDYVLLTLSKEKGTEFAYSQLWHRDYDDVRTIKLFVYLTDVENESDGPFTFLPGPVSDRFGFALRSHRSDKEILKQAQANEMKSIVAPRLSTFMVETSRCLHMGSRLAPGHSRLLYTATFITVPRIYPEPPPRFCLSGNESSIERCVLNSA